MKQFLAGCVVGAVAMALFDLQQRSTQGAEETPSQAERELSLLPDAKDRAVGGLFPDRSPAQADPTEGRSQGMRESDEGPWQEPESAAPAETVEAPPENPVITSEAHEALLEQARRRDRRPGSIAALHADFERQQPDLSWSYQAEQNLQAFLAGHAGISHFDVQHLECRQSLCELHVMGYGDNAGGIWNTLVRDMNAEPWWIEFQGSSNQSSGRDGQVVIVTVLQRAGYGGDSD